MIAMMVALVIRPPHHIVSQEDDPGRTPLSDEIDELSPAIQIADDLAWAEREPEPVQDLDATRPNPVFAPRPALADAGLLDLRPVDPPPTEVRGVEDVSPERLPESRTDRCYLPPRRVALTPGTDELDVLVGEAWAAGETDDGCSTPAAVAFPASSSPVGSFSLPLVVRGAAYRTSPASASSFAIPASINAVRPSWASNPPWTKLVRGTTSTELITSSLAGRGNPPEPEPRGQRYCHHLGSSTSPPSISSPAGWCS